VSTFSAGYPDDVVAGVEEGWAAFLQNLRIFLTHFSGQPSAAVVVSGASPDPMDATWERVRAALELDGVVERAGTGDLLVRTPDGLVNLVVYPWEGRTTITVRRMSFGPEAAAAAEREEAAWGAWMARHFPAAAG
jgi:hypothetical protein